MARMIPTIALLFACLGACDGGDDATPSAADAAVDACVLASGQIELPADDGLHDEVVEWWYWTGHLSDDDGGEYGFQVTFFAFGAGDTRALLANVALTDLTAGTFHRAAKFEFGAPERLDGRFAFALGAQTGVGGGGDDALHAEMDDRVLELVLHTDEPAVRQHDDGYHAYSFGGYTYYYSRPRMTASGSLMVNGETRPVTGTAWFDHQWGDLTVATSRGWDWFAINLDDGRDLMLFLVHGADGDERVGGSLRQPLCGAEEIPSEAVEVVALDEWTSPESGCVFPQGWLVRVGEETFEVTTRVAGQEQYNSRDNSKTYWEGAVDVTGDVTGRGYVELAGYCGG